MASSLHSELNQDYLIWCINILRSFADETMKFRKLVKQTGDASLEIHFITSTLDVCEKLEHISSVICSLIRNKKSFIKKITDLVDIQKKLEEVIKQPKISEGSLTVKVQEGKKGTKEMEIKANISEEKSPKEKLEEKKNDGDPTEAKALKKDSEEQKTNPEETKILKKRIEDSKDAKPAEMENGKPK